MPKSLIIIAIILTILFCFYIASVVKPAEGAEAKGAKMRQWQGIVVHHSGSNYDDYKKIDAYHRSKGWDMAGYHYIIEKDGKVVNSRPLWKDGAHAKTCGPNRNKTHIGICLAGDKTFTAIQLVALNILCEQLVKDYPITSIERHHEDCPGPGVAIEKLAKLVKK